MTTTINGRTPEKIKRGLECCKPVWVDNHWKTCDTKCPYIDDVGGFCRAQLMAEALDYIQLLEAAQLKWISVDNPPEEGGEYIVAAVTPDGRIVKSWDIFTTGSGWCSDKNVFEKVLYYMAFESLPEPPKEEE